MLKPCPFNKCAGTSLLGLRSLAAPCRTRWAHLHSQKLVLRRAVRIRKLLTVLHSNLSYEDMQGPYSQSMFQPSFGMNSGMYGTSFPQSYNPIQVEGKGKGKSREEAFEAAFEQFAEFQPQTSAKIEEVNDLSDIESALNKTTLDEKSDEPQTNEDFKKYECLLSVSVTRF